jgi:hypothetical protein
MRTIHVEDCRFEFHDWGCQTIFPDGATVDATPHDTHHYLVVSHRLGYGDNALAYCREHVVCHELIAQFIAGTHSEVLWCLAHGKIAAPAVVTYEELAAQALQRFIRANERPIVSGVNWGALKGYALAILDGEDSAGAGRWRDYAHEVS